MPFISSVEGAFGFGRGPNAADNIMRVQWSTYLPAAPTGFNPAESYGITDNLGNIYITGKYNTATVATQVNIKNVSGTTQAASTTPAFNLPGTSTTTNVYLIKFNESGQVVWATYFTQTGGNCFPGKLACDSSNNIYMVGGYQQSGASAILLRNAGGTSLVTLPTNSGGISSYLIKYSPTGDVQWATYLGAANQQHVMSDICIYSNFIYVVGYKSSGGQLTTTFMYSADGNTAAPFQTQSSITLPSTGSQPWGLILQYNTSGIAQWATVIPCSSVSLTRVICNNLGFPLVTGYYASTTTVTLQEAFNTGQAPSNWTLESSGATTSFSSVFIIKYVDLGYIAWATILKTNIAFNNWGYSLDTDAQRNVYVTGVYRQNTSAVNLKNADSINYNQSTSSVTLSNTATTGNMFLMKYNDNGAAQWALNLGTTSTTAIGYSLVVNKITKFIYIVGTYSSAAAITLNNASGNSQTSSLIGLPISTGRGFLMKYTLDGQAKCATHISDQSVTPYYISLLNNVLYIAINCGTIASNKSLFNASANGQTSTSYILSSFSPNTTVCNGVVKYTG